MNRLLLTLLALGLFLGPLVSAQSNPTIVSAQTSAVVEFRLGQLESRLAEQETERRAERLRLEGKLEQQEKKIADQRTGWEKQDQIWRDKVSWMVAVSSGVIALLLAILGLVGAANYFKSSLLEREAKDMLRRLEERLQQAERLVAKIKRHGDEAEELVEDLKGKTSDQMSGQQKEAVRRTAEHAGEKPPQERTADDWVILGLQAQEEQDYRRAEQCFTVAIGLEPDEAEAYFWRAYLYQAKLSELDRALADYDRALDLNPNDADAYNNRGVLKRQMNDWAGAVKDLEEAVGLEPEHQNSQLNLLEALVCAERGEEAQEQLEKLEGRLEPQHRPLLPLYDGLVALLTGASADRQEAELERALAAAAADGVAVDWGLKELRAWLPQSRLSPDDRERVKRWIDRVEAQREEIQQRAPAGPAKS